MELRASQCCTFVLIYENPVTKFKNRETMKTRCRYFFLYKKVKLLKYMKIFLNQKLVKDILCIDCMRIQSVNAHIYNTVTFKQNTVKAP